MDSDSESNWSGSDVEAFDDSTDDDVAVCIFCSHADASVAAMWSHMGSAHGFSMEAIKREVPDLDMYKRIRLINYLRSQPAPETRALLLEEISASSAFWSDDAYLQPRLPDDKLLFEIDDDEFSDDGMDEDGPCVIAEADLGAENHSAEEDVSFKGRSKGRSKGKPRRPSLLASSSADTAELMEQMRQEFTQHSSMHFSPSVLMQDIASLQQYVEFLRCVPLQGKTVVNIGHSVLSLYEAEFGAQVVQMVDNLALDTTETLVADNQKSSSITVQSVHTGAVPELSAEDLVVMEMPRAFLANLPYMVASRGVARVAPSRLVLHVAAADLSTMHFDASALRASQGYKTAQVETVRRVVSTSAQIGLDLQSLASAELSFPFQLNLAEDCDKVTALVFWFDALFTNEMCLSSGPESPATGWRQTVFHLSEAGQPFAFDGPLNGGRRALAGQLSLRPDNPGSYLVRFDTFDGQSFSWRWA